jgi:hypothetical protein
MFISKIVNIQKENIKIILNKLKFYFQVYLVEGLSQN